MGIFAFKHDAPAFAGGVARVLRQQFAAFVKGTGSQLTGLKRHLPDRAVFRPVRHAVVFHAQRAAIQQQLHLGGVCHDRHVDHLSRIPVPVDADMNHRRVRPDGLAQIPEVLGEDGGIHHAEIARACMIRGRFANIVNAAPQELSGGVGGQQILNQAFAQIDRAPAGGRIAQRGTLQIIVRENGGLNGHVINAAAGQDRGRFAAVNRPGGMIGMMLRVALFAVVVALCLNQVGATLCSRPRHEVAADGDAGIAVGVVQTYLFGQRRGGVRRIGIDIGIQNFVADGPHQQTGMITVTAHQGGHVRGHILREETRVVVGRFGTLPHVKRFVNYQNAHFVAQIHDLPCWRIVACAQGVHAHLLHGAELAAHGLFVEGSAQAAQIMVQTDTVQLHRLAVEQQSVVRRELNVAEANMLHDNLIAQHRHQLIDVRRIGRPQGRGINLHCGDSVRPFCRDFSTVNAYAIVKQQMHHMGVFRRAAQLRVHRHRPDVSIVRGGHINAIQRNVMGRQHMQRHIAVNAGTGVPAAVRALMADVDMQGVFPLV